MLVITYCKLENLVSGTTFTTHVPVCLSNGLSQIISAFKNRNMVSELRFKIKLWLLSVFSILKKKHWFYIDGYRLDN